MTINRTQIIEQLEQARKYVNEPELSVSKSQRDSLNESLDKCVHYAKYGRYHVTALGVFSTGKSTLLNAMLEDKILPAADLPVTAITTEIYYSDKTSFFIPAEKISEEVLEDFRSGIASFSGRTEVEIVNSLQRDGETVSGIGGILAEHNSGLIYEIIMELTSQQRRSQGPFAALKALLDSNHNLTLWLGISTLPTWLRDIVLTDAPGTGSIDDGHEIIINKVIPESQLVLYLIESARVGSAIDKRFCDRVSNTYHRKIFYVLNKIDQQNDDERADALDKAKRCVPDVAADGEKPEFLSSAGLYALFGNELESGKVTIEEVLSDSKINPTRLLISPEWGRADEQGKKKLLVDFLMRTSNFNSLQARIEEYLKEENKDIAIAEQANAVVADIAKIIVHGCDNTVRVLNSDSTVDELREKKDAAHELRCKYSKDAQHTIRDYEESALDLETGLGANIAALLTPVPNKLASLLNETLKDAASYRKLQEKEYLQKWLTKELQYCVEDVVRKIDNELNKRYSHLLEQLFPILKKIEDGSLANTLTSIHVKDEFSADTSNVPQVAGSALAGAVLFGGGAWVITALGVGASTATVTAPAAGLAGALAGWGLNSLSVWAAGMGWGTLATTTTTTTTLWGLSAAGFFIPVIGVGVAAATIVALFCFNKEWKIAKIVTKTKELLEKIVLTGGTIDEQEIIPVVAQMKKAVENAVRDSVDSISKRIETRLRQMDEEEEKLVEEYGKAAEIKQAKIGKILQLKKEIEQIGAEAQQKLKKAVVGGK